jgi:hypothetical protein
MMGPRVRTFLIAALPVLASGCGSSAASDRNASDSGPHKDAHSSIDARSSADAGPAMDATPKVTHDGGSAERDSMPDALVNNVAPLIVDHGPPGAQRINTPYVTVTICIPGTNTCQTIDHFMVDTGSVGVRVVASVLSNDMALPQVMSPPGTLDECEQYAGSEAWGSVRMADIKIAGELAANIPIHIIGDPSAPAAPSSCDSLGVLTDTVDTFFGNGLIGINYQVADCGPICTSNPPAPGGYYSCSGITCAPVAVPLDQQLPNPIARFAHDNNGAVIEFPESNIPAAGVATLAGSLTFGIGTQTNNAFVNATLIAPTSVGQFTTVIAGQTLPESFLDTGTPLCYFADNAIPQCMSQDLTGLYCPTSPVTVTGVDHGAADASASVSVTVASADVVDLDASAQNALFPNLAGTAVFSGGVDWGFPFFIGRRVYVGLVGASTPGGPGPYWAF